ncbi:secreted RxLR effector protein 161-like [Diospyros lotus]|uniref:secreted RxLR effector protein 161-like n=1 Tax=Diospyros lotus TaxID=55363 RepID=UPI002259D28D|nr:secreted RxLR effector protein 161-like [Diospyros lotus]
MTNNGLMTYFLGIQVQQNSNGISLSQEKYSRELLEKFGMGNCGVVTTPVMPNHQLSIEEDGAEVDATQYKRLIGSLRYLTMTRPDIEYGVRLLSRYMEAPKKSHWQATKRILRYVKGTLTMGLHYVCGVKFKLIGYSDSEWGRDPLERKSTTGYVFFGGSAAFSWTSNKQSIIALSSCDAEYVALASTVCEAIWLKNLLIALKHP